MKEIIRITLGLTVSCLIAAIVMGSVFAVTEKAKQRNERRSVQKTMLQLLGYENSDSAPSELSLHPIYRYIIGQEGATYVGYLIPVEAEGTTGYSLLVVDLRGNFVKNLGIDISEEEIPEAPDRKKALKEAFKTPVTLIYGDSTVIAELRDKRVAYLLPGGFPGFKTFIQVIVAIDPSFEIIGLEITEHEEDPGLGGEIEKDYFKKQFKGKSFETLKDLEVIKEPLPERYRQYLEAQDKTQLFSEEMIEEIRKKYRDQDIYALTGATISSRAVTSGVKSICKKFAFRIRILDRIIDQQGVKAAF